VWSGGQSSWLQIQRSRVRFPALPDFLRSSGSIKGSTQPREDKWGTIWMENRDLTTRHPLYPRKLALTAPTGGGCSAGMVRLRTRAAEFILYRLFTGSVWTSFVIQHQLTVNEITIELTCMDLWSSIMAIRVHLCESTWRSWGPEEASEEPVRRLRLEPCTPCHYLTVLNWWDS
jgi:hypothetical protein